VQNLTLVVKLWVFLVAVLALTVCGVVCVNWG